MSGDTNDWRLFKASQDDPALAPCPFCQIRHKPAQTHPYCDMVARFRLWRTSEDAAIARRYAGPPASRDPRP